MVSIGIFQLFKWTGEGSENKGLSLMMLSKRVERRFKRSKKVRKLPFVITSNNHPPQSNKGRIGKLLPLENLLLVKALIILLSPKGNSWMGRKIGLDIGLSRCLPSPGPPYDLRDKDKGTLRSPKIRYLKAYISQNNPHKI
jgi:hypothetical protein